MTLAALIALVGANRRILPDVEFKLSRALMLLFPQLQAAPSVSLTLPIHLPLEAGNRESSAALPSSFARAAPAWEGAR